MRQGLIAGIVLIVLLSSQGCASTQSDLRPELEKAFQAYQSAIVAGDGERFKQSLPNYRYVRMRNWSMSEKKERFPQSFFEQVKRVPNFIIDIKKLQHIKTVLLGDVAYMMYFNKEDERFGKGAAITSLLFVKESGQWKFAESEYEYFSGEEAQAPPSALAEKAVPTFHESPGVMSGKVPVAPPEYPRPDFVGSVIIRAENCMVTVMYNNSEFQIVEDSEVLNPFIGGLRRGKNLISIKVEPQKAPGAKAKGAETNPKAEVEVSAYSDGGEKVALVFSFATKEFGEVKREFEVTDEMISKGREALRPIK